MSAKEYMNRIREVIGSLEDTSLAAIEEAAA